MSETRTYARTHPWITFQLDLRRLPWTTWVMLGDAQAKCWQISGTPLMPAIAEHFQQVFLAKGALATTAIEGNTLTEAQALELVRHGLELPPSKEYLGKEIQNILDACNMIGDWVMEGGYGARLSVDHIKMFNTMTLNDLVLEDGVIPGEFRNYNVGVGHYRGAPAEDCEYLMARLCEWLDQSFRPSEDHQRIVFSILKAVVAHLYIAWIHPFGDGNGRVARLVEFYILLSGGVPTTAAHVLSNFYNETRSEYYRQLDYASKSGGDVTRFIDYAVRGFVDQLNAQIALIEAQQMRVHWLSYIYDVFRGKDKATDHRRRRLVLDLSEAPQPVSMTEIRHVSPRVAEAYAGLSDRTVARDVELLLEMGLLVTEKLQIRANVERMAAFLPPTVAITEDDMGQITEEELEKITGEVFEKFADPLSPSN